MRIAYDHQIFTNQKFGGISRYFARLADGVTKYGVQPRIFAGLHQNHYLSSLPQGMVKGFSLPAYAPSASRIRSKVNESLMLIGIRNWKPDIIHETYHKSRAFRYCGIPTVITIYDMIPELHPLEFAGAGNLIATKKSAAFEADHVICISHSTRADLLRLYDLEPEKVSVVHLGVDFLHRSNALTPDIKFRRPYFLFVGHRGGYKNFNLLLEAYVNSPVHKDYDLIAFGGGPFTKEESLYHAKLGVEDSRVLQLEGNDDLLSALYSGAQAFVYPSLYEGFGLPPLEAMAHDCPVISSNTSSMPEVIHDAAEFFDPHSVDDLRRALEIIASDTTRRNSLITAGRARLSLFTWENTARETAEKYKKLL